ncbi:MAG TPA: hypothetical protein VKQ72_06870 [Aggregatilineales bacterium]|nr:hypothetical protein [Aggregatilineales bacterium]
MNRVGVWFIAALIGLGAGIAGGLYYAWKVSPVVQMNTAPWQLSPDEQRRYLEVVSLAYAQDHDLKRAVDRLVQLRLGDQTWQNLADAACELARSSFVSTNTGISTVRSMVELAQSQGVQSCASIIMPLYTNTPLPTPTISTATPTLIPPASKTPTPTLGPTFTPSTAVPLQFTPTPAGNFRLTLSEPFCDPKTPGVIEVTVQDTDGTGVPGIQIEVSAADGTKDDFFSGLKLERGTGFADYLMTAGSAYTVILPGLSDRSRSLEANSCTVAPSDGGGKSTTSYRLVFRRTTTG